MDKQIARVCVLVKAYPQPSQQYEETVCCAAITDSGELRRIYPVPYRRLRPEQQFDRFDWIEGDMRQATDDLRPESYKIDPDTLRIIERGKRKDAATKARLWLAHVVESLSWLKEERKRTGKSLGIVRPDPGSVRFSWQSIVKADEADRALTLDSQRQASLFFPDPLERLDDPEFVFRYRFESRGNTHNMALHDWEVQAAYRNYKKRYGGVDLALEKMQEYYESRVTGMNLHFVLGNMQKRVSG